MIKLYRASIYIFFACLFTFSFTKKANAQSCDCNIGATTPTYTVNLSSKADTTWKLSYIANPLPSRGGDCNYNASKCGAATNCIKFVVTLNTQAAQVGFIKGNGSSNNGEVYINCGLVNGDTCGVPTVVNCPPTASSFTVTYCNAGANKDDYTISSTKGYSVTPTTTVRVGCPATLTASGLTNVTWNSVFPGASGQYNSYLSCSTPTVCATTTVTPQAGAPSLIKYVACGTISGCGSGSKCDTVYLYTSPTLTVTPTATNTVSCSGATVTLTASVSGGTAPYTYSWSPGGATTSSISVAPTATSTYSASVSDATSNCGAVTSTITITTQSIPTIPTVSATPNPVCDGSTLSLSASSDGATYSWTGPSSFSSSLQNPTVASMSTAKAGTYSVTSSTNGCTSPTATISVTVNQPPGAITATNSSPACEGNALSLTATTVSGASYSWSGPGGYSSATQNPVIGVTSTAHNGTYTVTVSIPGCTSSSATTNAVVHPYPNSPTASSNSPVCSGNTLSLNSSTVPNASTYTWNGPASFVSNSEDTTIASATTSQTGTYTVTAVVPGCGSVSGTTSVTVNQTPAAPTASGATVCEGTSATLTATAPGGTYQWYDAASGGTLLQTGASYITPALTTNATYYVQATISSCTGARTAVTVTVNASPAAPTASGATVCEGSAAILTATAPGGTYQWYDAASGGTLLQTGASYTTSSLSSNTTYYVQTTISGCAGPRTAVTVTVNPTPAAPTAASTAICSGTAATVAATAPGGTYQWYDAASGGTLLQTGASYTTPTLTTTTTYYVQTTVSGCVGPRTAVTVTVNAIPAAPTAAGATICESTSAVLTATAPGGTYEWYDAASGGTLLQTGAGYTTPALTSNTTYYVQSTISGCTGSRTAVTVTVNPTPAAPTSSDVTICVGTTATLTATAPGGTYEWYDAASGGTLLNTGASYTTPVLSGNTTYYVQTTVNGCDGPRTAVTVVVSAIPAAPTAGGATTCSGSSVVLTATAPGGTYEWYDAASGGTLLQTGASYTTPALTTTTSYYVQSTIAGCTGSRTTVTVTVNPIPAAPTASGTNICAGTTATLTATAPGGTYEWYDAASGGTLLQTGASYTTPTLTTTTTYYVETTVSGCTGSRTAVQVTVTSLPAAPTAASTTICAGFTATLNATAPGGTYEWYDAASGGTLLQTGAGYTTPTLTTTTTYYVQTTVNGCPGPRTAVNVTVTPTDNPSFSYSAGTYCQSGTTTPTITGGFSGTFSASPAGVVFVSTSTGQINLATSSAGTYTVTFTTSGPCTAQSSQLITITSTAVADFHYNSPFCKTSANPSPVFDNGGSAGVFSASPGGLSFVSTSSGQINLSGTTAGTYTVTNTITAVGCFTVTATNTVTIDPAATVNAGGDQTICAGSSTTLAGAFGGAAASAAWSGGAGGYTPNPSTLNAVYSPDAGEVTAGTVTLTLTTNDPAGACAAVSDNIAITINPIPAAPTAAGTTICEGDDATLTATAPGGTYQWYDASSGGTLLQTGASYTTPTLTTTTTYYVQTSSGGCTGTRTAVTVTVNPTPAAPTVAGATVCESTSATLTATAPGGTYEWYDAASGGTLLQTGASYTTAALSSNTTYYVQTTVNGCPGPRTAVTVTVNSTPAAPTASGTVICQGDDATLTATAPGGTYEWYSSVSGGTLLQTGANYNTPSLSANTTYYVQTTVNGCVGPRTAVTVTVNATPAAPTAADDMICEGTSTTLTASAPGGTYQWYDAASGGTLLQTGASYTTPTLTTTTTYYVQTTISGCVGPRTAVTVTVNPTPAAPTAAGVVICQGDDATLTATAPGGTYEWYSAASGGTLLQTGASYTTPTLTTSTAYYVQTTIAGCDGPRAAVTVTVNSTPAAPTAAGAVICEGDNATLTATAPGGTYEWYNSISGGTLLQTGASYTTIALSANTTYYVQTTVGGCPGPRTAVTVTVNPTPAAPTAANSDICFGTSSTLIATAPGGTYTWYDAATGGTLLQTGASYITPTLTTTTTYYVQTAVSGCDGPRTAVTVTVSPLPAVTSASSAAICSGGTVNIALTADIASTFSWIAADNANTTGESTSQQSSSTLNNTIINSTLVVQTVTYTVVPTAVASGCAGSPQTVTVTVNPTPSISASSNSPVCLGGDINLSATTTGGSTFTWTGPGGYSSSSQNPTISPSTTADAGTYSVSTTSAAGCTSTTTTTAVAINPPAPAPSAGSNSPVCSGATISLTVASIPAASYAWAGPNGFSSTLQNPTIGNALIAANGTYSIIATVPGCGPSSTGTVSVTVNLTPAAPSKGSNSPVCSGNDISLTASGTGVTYNWSGPGGFSSTTQNPVITNAATVNSGTYSATTTSADGCTSTAATTAVTVNQTPSAPIAGSNFPVCSGQTLSLTASNAGTSYSWIGPNGFSSALQNPTIGNVSTAADGTYSVTATSSSCTGPAGTVSVTITPTPAAPVATDNSPICEGIDLSLTASTVGGSSYAWTGPNGFSSASQNPVISPTTTADAGTYSVTATENGCTGIAGTVSVTINPSPAAPTVGNNTPVCEGNTISLTASTVSGTTYSWSGPNGFSSALQNPTIAPSATADAGTYSVFVTSTANGCTSTVVTTTVAVNPPPSAPIPGSNSPVCQGFTLSLTSNTIAGATYAWSGPNSYSSTLQNPAIASVPTSASGTYSLTASVAGCPPLATQTISVTIDPSPAAPSASGNTPVCVGDDISLAALSPETSYSWSGPGGFTSTLQDPIISPAATVNSGTYSVTVTSSNGCTSQPATVAIAVNSSPGAPLTGSNAPICEGQTLSLTAGTIPGATAYSWSGPNGFTSTSQNPTIGNATTAETGIYSVTASVPGCGTGPAGTVSVTVNAVPAAPVAGSNGTICMGEDLSLTAVAGGNPAYSWSGPNGFSSSSQNPVISPSTTAHAGTFSVTASENGCTSTSGTVTVVINTAPGAPVAGSNSPVCEGQDITLTANGTGTSYTWSGPNGFSSTNQNPVISPSSSSDAGTYSVTTSSAAGCTSTPSTATVAVTAPILVNAGSDQTTCASNATVALGGSVSGGTSTGNWTTSGTGTFVPTSATLNATYNASAADTTAGTVTLTLTSTNNGGCAPVNQAITITITDAPFANAGADQTLCANNATVTLNGSVNTAAAGGGWITLGSGTFSPDTFSLNASYVPGSADTAAGSATLVLFTTGNGNCTAASDTIRIFFTPAPTVNAGNNTVACNNNANVVLNGTSSTGNGTWSTPNGAGSFTPNPNTLAATYGSMPADTLAGSVTLVLSSDNNGNCAVVTDTLVVTYISKPVVNAGSDKTVCANNASVSLTGTSNTGAGIWSAVGGGGTFAPNALNSVFTPGAAQISAGTATVILTSSANGTCISVKDTVVVTITPAPAVSAGSNQTVCANNALVTLNGSSSGSTGAGWTTSGSGSFSPDTMTLNATYTPSAADTAAGSITLVITSTGNGLCNAVTDTMTILITPAPSINAGTDQVVCFSNPVVTLNGTSSTGGGTWSTPNGTGTFGSGSSLSTTYTVTPADTLAGSVTIVLTSSVNGNCNAETDTMTISFSNFPVVNAGGSQTVCANNPIVSLNGTSSTSAGVWTTSGTGTFAPNDSTLNAAYTPGASDISTGTVTLTLTSIGGCATTMDSVVVSIAPSPVVSAGSNQNVCAGTMTVTLGGTSSTGSGQWTTGGSGSFSPNNNTLNAQYILSSGDSAAGQVTLTLSSANNGNCNVVSAQMKIFVNQPAVANAGADLTVCGNNSAQLNGSVTGGSASGTWTTPNGSGTFAPSSSALNASYNAVNADTLAGNILLILTSTGNGACPASADTVVVKVNSGPAASAGADQTICANNAIVTLNGSVFNAAGGGWMTLGTGSFSPDTTTLNATYTASNADTAAGSVTLILATTGNGLCLSTEDTLIITFGPSPLVNAGTDILVCYGDSVAQLNGTVSGGASTGQWTTMGSGTFLPDNSTLNATYIMSPADTAAGTVKLILTSTSNGNCNAETDTVTVSTTPAPVVNAGNDVTVCANNDTISLNGSITIGASTGYWVTNGSGIFLPDSSALNGSYIPSAGDTAAQTVTLTLISANGCRAVSDSILATITPAPVVNAGPDVSICGGSPVALNGSVSSGATGGQWSSSGNGTFSPDDVTLNAAYLPGSNDTASVVLVLTSTGNGQCIAVTDTLRIAVGRSPVAAFSNSKICTGQSISFSDLSSVTGDTIVSWSWSFGDGGTDTLQNPTHTYAAAGSDSVLLVVTTTTGCTDTALHVVNVNASPVASFTFTIDCLKDSVFFADNSSIASGNITSWNWNFGDGTTSALQHPAHSYSTTGTFTITLSVSSDSGCTAAATGTLVSCSKAAAGFSSVLSICSGQAVSFTDTSFVMPGDSIISWNWNFGDGGTASIQNPTHVYTQAGTHTVTLVINTNLGSTDTATGMVTIYPSPAASYTFLTTCGLDSVYFTNTSVIPGGNITSWNWNFGDGDTSTAQHPVHFYDSLGVYIVSLTVTSDSGCTSVFNDTIVPGKSILASFADTIDCTLGVSFADLSQVSVPNDSIVSWIWNFGDGSSDSIRNPVHTYTAAGTYTVQLIATGAGGCTDTVSRVITLTPMATASFTPQGGTFNAGTGVSFTDLSSNASAWSWNFGDGGTSTAASPSYVYLMPGTYTAILIVTNSNGCPDTVSYPFVIKENVVAVPTAFTPNGDNMNDILYVRGGPLKEMDWRIYNEWGNEVFHSTDQSKGWDGTYKGKLQSAARFVYILKYVTVQDNAGGVSGSVTITK